MPWGYSSALNQSHSDHMHLQCMYTKANMISNMISSEGKEGDT